MTQPVANNEGFLQRTYSCLLRLRGDMNTSIPLSPVTKDELKLLAFLHGAEAVTEIKYLGTAAIPEWNPDEGAPKYVQGQDGEYRRLARKYDNIVNSGRGKMAVEKCFNTHLIDFDAIVEAVNPVDAIERQAAEAEAKSEISHAAELRKPPTGEGDASEGANPATGGLGAAVAATIANRSRN